MQSVFVVEAFVRRGRGRSLIGSGWVGCPCGEGMDALFSSCPSCLRQDCAGLEAGVACRCLQALHLGGIKLQWGSLPTR